MKGFAAFFALLLITSTASLPVTLDTAGIPSCSAAVGGCAFSALLILSGIPSTVVDTADVVVANSGPIISLVIVNADTKCKSLGITGLTTVTTLPGTTTTVDGPVTIGKNAVMSLGGTFVADAAGVASTVQSSVSGALTILASAQAFWKAGLQVGTTGVVTLADGAHAQISGAQSTVEGVLKAGKNAVIEYVDTTCRFADSATTQIVATIAVTRSNIETYGAAGASVVFQLTGSATLKVYSAVAAVGSIAATGKSNVVIIAQGTYCSITGAIVAAVGSSLQFVNSFYAAHQIVVSGDLILSPGNCDAFPTFGGGITSTQGSTILVQANVFIVNQFTSVLAGGLTFVGGVVYTATNGVHTFAQLVVTGVNVGLMAVGTTLIQATKYSSTVADAVTIAGNVVLGVNP